MNTELIAEIGASALVNVAGLETTNSFRNSTAYILKPSYRWQVFSVSWSWL